MGTCAPCDEAADVEEKNMEKQLKSERIPTTDSYAQYETKCNSLTSDEYEATLNEIVGDINNDIDVLNKHAPDWLTAVVKRMQNEYKEDMDSAQIPENSSSAEDLIEINSVQEIQNLIQQNQNTGKIIRCAGSQHSAPQAVFGNASASQDNIIHIKLEKQLRVIELIEESESKTDGKYALIRVGCGCNLGIDPSDPHSNADNSLNRTIDKWGYALPITGGITHQTLGGFLSCGSAGGSIKYSFVDIVQAIEWVDGNGDIQVAKRGEDTFDAVGISMGLYGVLTHLTIKIGPTFLVKGSEETVDVTESVLKDGPAFLEWMKQNDYIRCLWFPQPGTKRAMQYSARQVSTDNTIVEYHHTLDEKYMNYLAAFVMWMINKLQTEDGGLLNKISDFLLRLMLPLESNEFCDHWYIAIPNDDQVMSDTIMRIQFSEIWMDTNETQNVIDVLQELFDNDDVAGGNFGVELYPAKRSSFWLSPAYDRDCIRVNAFWWEHNVEGSLAEYFSKFWNVLFNSDKIKTLPRLHWGKHFPAVGTKYEAFTIGSEYCNKAFPKFKQWMQLRDKYDPKQLFVTDYWRNLLGIPQND